MTFARSELGFSDCSKSAIRASISPIVVLMIAWPVLRSPLARASEILERQTRLSFALEQQVRM